jgi:hypothetical protein
MRLGLLWIRTCVPGDPAHVCRSRRLGDDVKIGAVCLFDALMPANWLFAPLLIAYSLSNLVMLASPFAAAGPTSVRTVLARFAFVAFAVTFTVPYCETGVTRLLGCYFWMVSFPLVGVGFLVMPNVAQKTIESIRAEHSRASRLQARRERRRIAMGKDELGIG